MKATFGVRQYGRGVIRFDDLWSVARVVRRRFPACFFLGPGGSVLATTPPLSSLEPFTCDAFETRWWLLRPFSSCWSAPANTPCRPQLLRAIRKTARQKLLQLLRTWPRLKSKPG